MSGSKCPEMIGYVGDVRNLEAHRAEATSNAKIEAWVQRSKSVEFATLFYSSDDVYHVGRMRSKLLQINPKLKFQQISSIKEFIDYVDTGMDRNEHPVQDIEMINVYTTWSKEVDYVEEAGKRHEPEVRQVSGETVNELFSAMVIHIFLGNKEQNQTKPLTDAEVYQQVKDSYGWDQASAIKDQIMTAADTAKSGVDELKEKRELLTKGVKSLPKVKPQSILIKGMRYAGPIGEIVDAYDKIDKVKDANKKFEFQQKIITQCFEDEKNKYNGDFKRCINLQQNTLINFQEDIYKAVGLDALSPKNIEKIEEAIKNAK